MIFTDGEAFEFRAPGTDEGAEVARMILEIANGSDTGLEEILFGDLADTVEGSDGEWFEELDFFGFANDGEAVWFFEVTGEFSEQFIGGDADGGGETLVLEDGLFDALSKGDGL